MIVKAINAPLERVRVLQRRLYLAAKASPKRKFGVLYDKVCQIGVPKSAYEQVRANKGASGIDRQTFEMIEGEIGVATFLDEIRTSLIEKRYKPMPVRRVYIPKGRWNAKTAGHPSDRRSCSTGSSEIRHRASI